MKIKFIVNTSNKKQRKIIPIIKRKFEHKEYSIFYSKSIEDTKRELREAKKENFTHIVSIGGDGTIMSIIEELIGSNFIFGIIPAGSGNGIAHHLDILDYEKACDTILSDNIIHADVGVVNGRHFFSCTSIGFDALITKISKSIPLPFRGVWIYWLAGLIALFKYRYTKVKIIFNKKEIIVSPLLTVVSNGRYYGANAQINPDAVLDDGRLNLAILDLKLWQLPFNVLKIFTGKIKKINSSEFYEIEKLKLIPDNVVPMQIDGEYLIDTKEEINITIKKKVIKLLFPK